MGFFASRAAAAGCCVALRKGGWGLGDFEFDPTLVMLAVGVVAVAVVGAVLALRADFVIRHRPGKALRLRGRIPPGKAGAIREFFERDLRAGVPVTVRGLFGPRRRLKLRILGPLPAGLKQRVRNFLIDLLR
jgi:hypothetical protein